MPHCYVERMTADHNARHRGRRRGTHDHCKAGWVTTVALLAIFALIPGGCANLNRAPSDTGSYFGGASEPEHVMVRIRGKEREAL
jgi:hypothetical protein